MAWDWVKVEAVLLLVFIVSAGIIEVGKTGQERADEAQKPSKPWAVASIVVLIAIPCLRVLGVL